MNVTVPAGYCAVCTNGLIGDRLELDLLFHGDEYHVAVCRFCLAEHAPDLLAMLQEHVE